MKAGSLQMLAIQLHWLLLHSFVQWMSVAAGASKGATTNGQAAMSAQPPQPQLTPAQAAAQAAISNGIAHQNGVVPVRTGLAWVPGGAPPPPPPPPPPPHPPSPFLSCSHVDSKSKERSLLDANVHGISYADHNHFTCCIRIELQSTSLSP